MDWTNKNVHPSKVCHLGDEVEVMVLDVDTDRRRISLGMKQCVPNPWEEFSALHEKGDRITGKISSITDFGVFIGLDGDIDGLIHLSDLSWDDTGEEVARQYKKGDEVTAVVLAVDPDRERISLGVKQAEEDPFSSYVSGHSKGSTVKGTVSAMDVKGVTVILASGVEGHLRATELSRDTQHNLQQGDEIEAKIISIERKSRRISLSVLALETELEGQAMQDYAVKASAATTSLGDKLKEQLSRQEDVDDGGSD